MKLARALVASMLWLSYGLAHHGFDRRTRVRFLRDVPTGAGKFCVHSGGNAAARKASLSELDSFLSRHLQTR